MMPTTHHLSITSITGNSKSKSLEAPHGAAAYIRRGSAPPPVILSTSPSPHHSQGGGGGSRKNSSPDVGHNSSASSGPLSILGLVKSKASKSNNNSLNSSSEALSGYPVPHRPSGGDSMSMYALSESMAEEDEYLPPNPHDGIRKRDDDLIAGEEGMVGADEDVECARFNPETTVNFNMDSLKDMLKCVSCHRFLFPPILQCVGGHMSCKTCFQVRQSCHKCQQKLLQVPAKFAEMITEQFKVQCSFVEKGCNETVPFKFRRDHEEICSFKPVQCPEFDCTVTKPMNEIFKHFRLEHHHHFVNAHGNVFNGDIRCDDSNMVMGVERKWAPTMMKLEGTGVNDEDSGSSAGANGHSMTISGTQHFFLEILRTKHGVWHMWIWYLGEPDDATQFRCEIAIKKKNRDEDTELKYSGRVHSIRIPPHRIILSGCLLSFSDYTASHFRYLGDGHQGHPVIDYRVTVSRTKKRSSSSERAMAAGLTKMLRRFSIDSGGNKANKPNLGPLTDSDY
ncbi:hypothetical protein TCAL_09189 [Tigriopus californicus]|uniref:SIAH-type domain-containing protein n=1 Tax=Tigriopus californicus TaxID=6832 RepID=A0A553PA14_TIGCA|nr:uncharacterized protein LOC131893587 [Tigriopus californicus]XP_059099655.1 uncharacterized protein LOC131893587 [Tigriopus californicus]XP_059099656.1 uncharacterized protein LOC131893587 [Tigriopus californicus]XP_059099657.1 uncharacterized protein LOC131893587 [Tigriopus californicus]XP_059099658.1 uncharacterized protein LOC131893587 [Tigriopus californicus]TRY74508.1 hypothetical protein TCAL_09189 [Tigriopus californicus]|eukprot:TCALIF_09189-PA protein Name:"Similar to SINAT4 E3 ubiquitin-protein ligase SINAT4 (Arabidopsis thaliana)" AED:0.00 eAED:0.00 QI:354/1/1/1/1/1/2/395/507